MDFGAGMGASLSVQEGERALEKGNF